MLQKIKKIIKSNLQQLKELAINTACQSICRLQNVLF